MPNNIEQRPFRILLSKIAKPLIENMKGNHRLNKFYNTVKESDIAPEDFAQKVLSELKIQYEFPPEEIQALQQIKGPLVFVSNHPFGGVEAFIIIHLMSKIRSDYRLMANDLLHRVPELQNALVYLNPTRDVAQDREIHQNPAAAINVRKLVSYLTEGGLLGIFPNGETIEQKPLGEPYPLQKWSSDIAHLISLTKATVIPIYFHGRSNFFYRLAGFLSSDLRKQLAAHEFLSEKGKKIDIRIGNKIPPSRISEFKDDYEGINKYIQSKLYLLSLHFIGGKFVNILQTPMPAFNFFNEQSDAKEVIPSVDKMLIAREIEKLPSECKLVDADPFCILAVLKSQAPNLMREVGRQREITFRGVGEGSGKDCDIDEFDEFYTQLILWDKKNQQVAGGYRIGALDKILKEKGKKGIYIATIFNIEEELLWQVKNGIELGRSFVTKDYQRSYQPLLLLWTGICQYILRPENMHYRYIIGPVSISSEMQSTSKTLLVNFLSENQLAQEHSQYVSPKNPFQGISKAKGYFNTFSIADMRDVQEAITELEDNQMGVPVLFKHYLKMGAKMLAFNVDPDFSDVLDCLMMTDLHKTDRHLLGKYMTKSGLETYMKYHKL
jgi:putative hemolysin